MKKLLTLTFISIQLFFLTPLYSAVYDASTLYNSVTRAETVQDLFLQRWGILSEKNFYFDIYGKINWVFGFDVNTINAGTGQTEPTDLRLTRTYGSMTLALPFGKKDDPKEPSSFLVALTTTGFHYGLTKKIEIDRGSAGNESVTDYKHSQFFDDIYAVSILWRPYLTVHAGLIYNNEYAPEEDGTMDYFDPVNSYHKKFFALNVYGAMALSMNINKEGKAESTKAEVGINKVVGFVTDLSNPYLPLLFIGFERTAAYNDEPYESVWVGDPAADKKDSAIYYSLSLRLTQRFSELFTLEGLYSAQYITKEIYTKTTDQKIDVSKSKEWYIKLNLDPVRKPDTSGFKAYTGMSWYWDPAVAIHRNKPSKGNAVYGWILGANVDFVMFGAELMVERNFSSELKKLLETTDKWAVEGSLFFRI